MRIYSLIILLVLPLALRSCQPQNLPTVGDIVVRGREVVTDSSDVIKKQGGYQGILIIGDDSETGHGQSMKKIIQGLVTYGGIGANDISIPEENLVFFKDFGYPVVDDKGIITSNRGLQMLTSREYEHLRRNTRVVHIPSFTSLEGANNAPWITENNILFALSSGNTYKTQGDRDFWNTRHIFWQQGDNIQYYNGALASYNTGKVIAATSAIETEGGDIVPSEAVVKCGDIAEWCFAVLPRGYTSGASARLAAMAFYLAQLYPTAEEIVETMNVCAIDIGEPGIDREFGRGLANIVCAPVFEKELEAAKQVSSVTAHSPHSGENAFF